MSPISRRRVIRISAAAAGLALIPFGRAVRCDAAAPATWSGTALGAAASIRIHHRSTAEAERLIRRSLAEVRRLERIFSLYRADSALVELNTHRILVAPPPELVALLNECRTYCELTEGAFDPTVQPLWQLFAAHFSQAGADPAGPPAAALEPVLERVGYRHLIVGPDRVAFARRGMGLTLNGIAQGYITDRVVDLLRAGGVEQSLVDMGEMRALGNNPTGRPWSVGINHPEQPDVVLRTLDVVDQAVATSSGGALRFDAAGRFNHIFDPRTGGCAHGHRLVTVVMPSATAADALSTAFSILPDESALRIARKFSGVRLLFS
jgi:thiamine biosynthesis lipoprotein